jgi:hypothetical protein
MTTRIDQFYQGPVFVDAYWTESSASLSTSGSNAEREVGPGEGRATLAVVLLNRGLQDISAATGYLQLPAGFEPAGTSINPEAYTIMSASGNRLGLHGPATASFNSVIPAKSSFTLYFDVNILDSAKVGTQMSQLVVQYYRATDPGLCTSALLKFPLVLSGKTILDIAVTGNYLIPKSPNTVTISIINKGTADATGVVASIVNLGDSRSTSSRSSDGSVVLQSSQTKLINLGENTFNIGTVPANSTVTVSTVIFPSKDAASSVQNMDIQLTYGNAYGDRQNAIIGSGLVVLPNPVETSVGVMYDDTNDSHILTAEKLETLGFTVTNNSPSRLTDVVMSITPQSTSLTIVGNSKWTIPVLEPDEKQRISTKVIAAKSMISNPTSFTVNLNYVSEGEEKSDSLSLGAFVTGDIKIQVYDLSVNYIGDTPTIVGNILNQGNTAALYTSIQILSLPQNSTDPRVQTMQNSNDFGKQAFASKNGTQSNMPPQYVGDISADSSIPFSIPVKQANLLKPGMNPVTLKIAYADDLKNFHDLVLDAQVSFEQKQNPANSDRVRQGPMFGIMQTIFIPIIAVAAIVVAVVIIRKQRISKNPKLINKQNNFESEIDTLLDEHTNKDNQ